MRLPDQNTFQLTLFLSFNFDMIQNFRQNYIFLLILPQLPFGHLGRQLPKLQNVSFPHGMIVLSHYSQIGDPLHIWPLLYQYAGSWKKV